LETGGKLAKTLLQVRHLRKRREQQKVRKNTYASEGEVKGENIAMGNRGYVK